MATPDFRRAAGLAKWPSAHAVALEHRVVLQDRLALRVGRDRWHSPAVWANWVSRGWPKLSVAQHRAVRRSTCTRHDRLASGSAGRNRNTRSRNEDRDNRS